MVQIQSRLPTKTKTYKLREGLFLCQKPLRENAGENPGKRRFAMLILTRRPGETLIIESPAGEQIKVTVLSIKGNQVSIGTAAPDDISIVREELLERLPAEG